MTRPATFLLALVLVLLAACGGDTEGPGDTTEVLPVTPISFVSVSAGIPHTCGVTTSGEAYCWGGNEDGQLGIGGITFAATTRPVPVLGDLAFASVSAGAGSDRPPEASARTQWLVD